MGDKIFLHGLEAKCIIGIFDWERKVKQRIVVDMEFPGNIAKAAKTDALESTIDYKGIAKTSLKFISESSYKLIETLAEDLAQLLLKKFSLEEIKLRVSKPGAVRYSKNVGVEIIRKRKHRRRRS